MAKHYIDPTIIIPWFDHEGMKQRSHLVFSGRVSTRRVKREVARFMRDNFNCKPHSGFVHSIVTANIKAFTQVMNPAMRIASRRVGLDAQIEEWIQRIQDGQNEDDGHPTGEETLSDSTAEPMPAVQEEPARDPI